MDPQISLPKSYGTDKLVLMPRDPTWAHAYWDIADPQVSSASRWDGRKFMLSLFEARGKRLVAQQEIEFGRGSVDLPIPAPGLPYFAELSVQHDGRQTVLRRS